MTSNVKEFLMTLAATTVSIILTFGTTAIIDRCKERSDKRETLKESEQVSEGLKEINK